MLPALVEEDMPIAFSEVSARLGGRGGLEPDRTSREESADGRAGGRAELRDDLAAALSASESGSCFGFCPRMNCKTSVS